MSLQAVLERVVHRTTRAAGKLYELARLAGLYLHDSIYLRERRSARREPTDGIVVVRLDNIGDYVLWTACIGDIGRHYQGRPLHLVCNAAWRELASREVWTSVTEVNVAQFGKNLGYRRAVFDTIRALRPRTVINPTFSRAFSNDDAVVRISGAPERIGQRGDTSNTPALAKLVSDRFYTRLVDLPAGSHELVNARAFANALTGEAAPLSLPRLDFPAAPSIVSAPYAVLFPGASWPGKRWPAERFAEIGERLVAQAGLSIAICGADTDQTAAEIIASGIEHALNLTGRTSLVELATILRNAAIVITNDTSAAHIAAAAQTPVICVTGGGHFGRFIPYPDAGEPSSLTCVHTQMACFGCNWHCIFPTPPNAPTPCIANIGVESVWGVVQSLLLDCGLHSQTADGNTRAVS